VRILVLGGTVFLGRHFTEAALEAGHELTLFNRGEHNPELFPEVARIRGDRAHDIEKLPGGEWDVVLDTSGYFPRDVAASAGRLATMADRYIFVSSLSVFADAFSTPGIDENGRLATTDDVDATEITGENYGALKALCEKAAETAMPGRTLVVRPGLIVGPSDPTDRFTYWPVRLGRGGDVLAPAPEADPVQIIDVRDLAAWILDVAARRATGIYNATGPDYELTLGALLLSARDAVGTPSNLIWVEPGWLVGREVKPWTELPLWIPNAPGFARFDCSKAFAAGLRFRPLAETVRDTLDWATTREGHEWRAGLPAEREAELLELWHEREVKTSI
jgi:2'-hydroxyisoflavone reductase